MAVSASSAQQLGLRLDRAGLRLLRTYLHQPPLEKTMATLGLLAGNGAIWVVIGSLAAIADRRRRWRWLAAGALGPITIGANWPLKRRISRPRPSLELKRLGRVPSEHSFPSSHAASSFASAAAMARLAPSKGRFFFGLAALISIGRPYLGVHYPSDVLGGALLGTAIGVPAGHLLACGRDGAGR